jgi:molecular chaperone HtpG
MPENFHPHIGKNVIETLTLGMYEDSRYIFREYIQNSADQIDVAVEGKILHAKDDGYIKITIEPEIRRIQIEDNATGISEESVLPFLGDIANSTKDVNIRKGFRGIGRLGGLGYCNKLRFETSYLGETVKSVMTLDAKQLKKMITDINVNLDASSVISAVISLDHEDEDRDKHYFSVILEDVTNDELMNVDSVWNYLTMVAPVPFRKKFTFGEKIRKEFVTNNINLEEYRVFLGDRQLYKGYKNSVLGKEGNPDSKILDIDFHKIKSNNGDLIAFAWYGISNSLNTKMTASNLDRGIRIRKNNICIGSEDTLNRFFNEDRYNQHFIGEIHVIGSEFRPNARRDYFNDNFTIRSFEDELRSLAKRLYKLAHQSSVIRNRHGELKTYQQATKDFLENKHGANKRDLESAQTKAERAKVVLDSIKEKVNQDPVIKTIYENIVGDVLDELSVEPIAKEIRVIKKDAPLFKSLTDKERDIILEIFEIIDSTISEADAKMLKDRITERFE